MSWKQWGERLFNWELWPFWMRYAFIAPVWSWYCLRAGSLWFFTPSNPTLTFGGFEGEGKKEMYEQLPQHLYPKTSYILPTENFQQVKERIFSEGFTYPFIVKPDVGMKGLLFRKIDNEQQWENYHRLIPVEYIVQELVTLPLEVSVFYYRHPAEQKGVISGFIQKDLMIVKGNGVQTLRSLILQHPKAKHRLDEMQLKHEQQLDRILAKDEEYILAYAANLNRGATFTNLHHLADENMIAMFDRISHDTQFYYGRYDIKCASVDELKKGNFSILEYNGSGAEPNHVYHMGYSLFHAQSVFLQHWKALYEISKYNNDHGIPYWPYKKGRDFLFQAKKHLAVLEEYERKILL